MVLDYLQGLSLPLFEKPEVYLRRPMGPSKPTLNTKASYNQEIIAFIFMSKLEKMETREATSL